MANRKHSRLSEEERREVLEQLVQRHTRLTDAEVEQLDEVFGDIYTAQRPEVWKLLQSRRLKVEEAEDIFNESMLDLYSSLVDDGFPIKLSSFVRVIAQRKMWKLVMAKANSPVSLGLPSSSTEHPRSSGPMSAVDRAMDRKAIAEGLVPQLTPEQQWLFDRAVVKEQPLPSIAAELQVSLGTVKTRVLALRKAIVALAKEFKKKGTP
jgi:RNA polymerase sigma factor (sigma-70 family)